MWLRGAEAEAGVPRAASTLCNLYHEAGQRLRRLQDQLSARDALIARLRARLAAQEAEAAPSLVDALLEQVARYREQLRRQEGGASEEVAALRQEIERLKEQLEEKESQVQMLMEPLCPQEADTALQARARATSSVLCRSLASEAHQLRRTLAATAHMCQQLAQCLEERQRANGGTETPKEPEGTSRNTADQAEVDKLRQENQQLKAKITHVEDLNAKWQRYDASRDEYVRGLQAQLRELQAPRQPEGPSAPAALLQKEISRLNQQLEETLGDCAEARRELAATQEARDAALERVQMLEQQILVYKDDFSSERADRERAQSRFQELWDTVACMQCQVPRRQEPWEPGRTRLRSSTAQCLETDTLEPAVPRSQKLGSPQLKPPAEGGCPGQGSQGDLQCPHCQQHFSDEQGEELLRHMAECCQ